MKKTQFLSVFLFIFLLQACGQKGDLYHLEEQETIQVEEEEL